MSSLDRVENSVLSTTWKSKVTDLINSRLIQTVALVSLPIIAFSSYLAGACLGIGFGFWQWGRLQLELSALYHMSFDHPKDEDYSEKVIRDWTFYTNLKTRSSLFTAARFHTDKVASYKGVNIYLGALPLKKHGNWLKDQGVKHVFSIVEKWEIKKLPHFIAEAMTPSKWKEKEITSYSFPQKDRSNLPPDVLSTIVTSAQRALEKDESILFHCQAGRGRSAQALAAFLCKMTNLPVEEVCQYIQKARPQASISLKRQENIIKSMKN